LDSVLGGGSVEGLILALLLAAAPVASAQTTTIIERPARGYVELSPAQRTIIQRRVVRERRVVAPPPQLELRVGAPIPQAVELYPLPDDVYVEVPSVKRYRYFQVHDQVVLVDPDTSEIVEIIRD
jgi:hypothetical protein